MLVWQDSSSILSHISAGWCCAQSWTHFSGYGCAGEDTDHFLMSILSYLCICIKNHFTVHYCSVSSYNARVVQLGFLLNGAVILIKDTQSVIHNTALQFWKPAQQPARSRPDITSGDQTQFILVLCNHLSLLPIKQTV